VVLLRLTGPLRQAPPLLPLERPGRPDALAQVAGTAVSLRIEVTGRVPARTPPCSCTLMTCTRCGRRR
jgi:hypothetical protein